MRLFKPIAADDLLGPQIPLLFVFIWSTGFIVARLVAPHAEPLTFLMLRYGFSIVIFTTLAVTARAPWPSGLIGWQHAAIAGVLMQAMYLGGVFWSVRHGLPASIAALVGGMQPLLTAVLAWRLLGEQVSPRRWVGIVVGLIGAMLVLVPRAVAARGAPLAPVGICLLGMVALTLGTIWQKRAAVSADLRTNAAVQFMAAAAVTAPFAYGLEHRGFDLSLAAIIGLLWSVFGLSVGAISLLLLLIRRGAVAGVASLFFLVPPVTALLAFAAFGEHLTPIQIGGMALAAVGVGLASRG